MVNPFRYHEISEAPSRILNPLSHAKLDELGERCHLRAGQRHLDLACGKGEMLCRFAHDHGTSGVGIDLHPPFLDAARARADELGVTDRVRFVEGDAAHPPASAEIGDGFDVVSCLGATWIGGGLGGTLALMREHARPGALLLVGEVFWANEPSPETREREEAAQTFADLHGTLERIEAAGLELVDLVVTNQDEWDRYAAGQWHAVADWLAAHPTDPDAAEIRAINDEARRAYLSELRRVMGWAVFVLREPATN